MDNTFIFILILIFIVIILFIISKFTCDNFIITNTNDETLYLNNSRSMAFWNIPNFKEVILRRILEAIIKQINTELEASYYLLNYENVFTMPVNNTSMIIIIDFWVHDTINKITKRLITRILIDSMKQQLQVLELNISNGELINGNIDSNLLEPSIDPQLILTDKNLLPDNKIISGIEEINLDYSKYIPYEV